MSLVLLAAGCTTEDGPAYDIPARLQVMQAQFEAGPDGSPMILAQIGMYYRTASPDTESGGGYQMRNFQSIAYTKDGGNWNAHSFRNLQKEEPNSCLLRNSEGEIQALIRNFDRLDLYALQGNDWVLKKTSSLGGVGSDGYHLLRLGMERPFGLIGDSAWQVVEAQFFPNAPPNLRVGGSDGTHFELAPQLNNFSAGIIVSAKRFDYLIQFGWRADSDSELVSQVVCYRWSLDPANPNPRKQVLEMETSPANYLPFAATISGETRVYQPMGTGSLAEFALRGDTLAFTGLRTFPASPDSAQGKEVHAGTPDVDPKGCLHSLFAIRDSLTAALPQTYYHRSSCEDAEDTLRLPFPTPIPSSFESRFSGLRWAPDGSPMILLTLTSWDFRFDTHRAESFSSWIYFGRRGPGKTWTWEKVAEF